MGTFIYRVLGASSLEAAVFEDVESDPRAIWQATAVVVLSSVATGLGAGGLFDRRPAAFAVMSAVALVTWAAWAMLTLQIGTRFLPEPDTRADFGQLLRTVGFAAAPGCLQVFAMFPRVTVPIIAVTTVWMFAAMVVAVQHALDYRSVWRALAVCGLAVLLSFGMAIAIGVLFGPAAS